MVDLSPYRTSQFSRKIDTCFCVDTEHGGVVEEVCCYRSDLPLWAPPLTPWAPVATPNPLGRGAGGAKHLITCLFRQPPMPEKFLLLFQSFFQSKFIRTALPGVFPSWTCPRLRPNEGNEGDMTRWERGDLCKGGKGSTGVPQARSNSPQTPLRASPLPGRSVNFLKGAIFVHKKQLSIYK